MALSGDVLLCIRWACSFFSDS